MRALRIVYSNHKSSFNILVEKDSTLSTYARNTQTLAIEIYKFLQGLSLIIMGDVLKLNRTRTELYSGKLKTLKFGTVKIVPFINLFVPNAPFLYPL